MPRAAALAVIVLLAGATASFADPMPRLFAPALRPNIHPAATLRTWKYIIHRGDDQNAAEFEETFVGTNPKDGASTTIPAYLIPIKLSATYNGKPFITNPSKKGEGGRSPVAYTLNSPIFKNLDYVQGGVDVGNTQYEDAFQRAALWRVVQNQMSYHVLLGTPKVEKSVALTAVGGKVQNEFGVEVITVDIDAFDSAIQPLFRKFNIPVDSLPIFITTQTYLTAGGGCCIGGYYNYNGTHSYVVFTFIQATGIVFGMDVSLLSHVAGEWLDDPYTNNQSLCGEYDVGLPLQDEKNYGTYPYTLNGFTYHLQDLVLTPYFGAPKKEAVNGQFSFQGAKLTACQNGP